jgi:F0F1-type ATP synthase assembly protein I
MSRTLAKREEQRLERLEMRYRYLTKRIKQAEETGAATPSYIKGEASALRWAIDLIKYYTKGEM